MADSAVQAAAKFRNVASSIERAQKQALAKAGSAGRSVMLRAAGAPHQVAKRKVDVKVRVTDNAVTLAWSPPGLTRIVNDPTKPHLIRPKKFVGTRGTGRRVQKGAAVLAAFGLDAHSGRGAVRLANGNLRSAVMHPGTRGKHFVEKGKDAARPIVTRTFATSVLSEPMKQVFGG